MPRSFLAGLCSKEALGPDSSGTLPTVVAGRLHLFLSLATQLDKPINDPQCDRSSISVGLRSLWSSYYGPHHISCRMHVPRLYKNFFQV